MLNATLAPPQRAHLALADVSHAFAVNGIERAAVARASLRLAPGEFLSVIGPSGCGKSTLLRIAGGLLTPTHGEVTVAGRAIADAQRERQIGVVFQDPSLLPWRTVAENVRLPFEIVGGGTRSRGDAQVEDLLALVGLSDFRDYRPHQLSGGMRGRVAIARALALSPSLLLMDEPFGALDDITRTEMRHELLRIHARLRTTVLFVTHSITEAVLLSDRVAVMVGQPGRIGAVLPIGLPHPRTADSEDSPEFRDLARRLRAALRGEVA